MIRVVRLSGSYVPEQLAVQGLDQRGVVDVIHGYVGIHTGLHVPSGINMKVFSPCSDTTVHIRAVIPKIENKHWF